MTFVRPHRSSHIKKRKVHLEGKYKTWVSLRKEHNQALYLCVPLSLFILRAYLVFFFFLAFAQSEFISFLQLSHVLWVTVSSHSSLTHAFYFSTTEMVALNVYPLNIDSPISSKYKTEAIFVTRSCHYSS